jgi:hypothetical protein
MVQALHSNSQIALLFSMSLLNTVSLLLAFASASTDSAFTFLLDMFGIAHGSGGGDEAALVALAPVVEGRLHRAGPRELLRALDEPHRRRVGGRTPMELRAPGERLLALHAPQPRRQRWEAAGRRALLLMGDSGGGYGGGVDEDPESCGGGGVARRRSYSSHMCRSSSTQVTDTSTSSSSPRMCLTDRTSAPPAISDSLAIRSRKEVERGKARMRVSPPT